MAKSSPRVSVIMPVYNTAAFVGEAIESILGQSFGDLELIVVDDRSSDGSWEIVERFARQDARVRAFRNDENRRIVYTRNRGFDEASTGSEYYAIMDSDDVSEPERLAHQVAFLDAHSEHALVGGNLIVIDERSRPVAERVYPSSYEQIKAVITRYNPIAQPTAMIRKRALEAVGRYDTRYSRCQDYDLWLRMAARYPIANLSEFTLRYRLSETQGKRAELRESLRFTIEIQRKWLLEPKFFRPWNVAYWGLEHGLLALPKPVVLWLFGRIAYRAKGREDTGGAA